MFYIRACIYFKKTVTCTQNPWAQSWHNFGSSHFPSELIELKDYITLVVHISPQCLLSSNLTYLLYRSSHFPSKLKATNFPWQLIELKADITLVLQISPNGLLSWHNFGTTKFPRQLIELKDDITLVVQISQGWALRSFQFGTLRSFPFFKKNVPFFSRVFGDLWAGLGIRSFQ